MPKSTKPKAAKQWLPSPPTEQRIGLVSCLAHFSSKYTNTNALPTLVRLAADERVTLPYVSVSTEGPGRVPLDYLGSAQSMRVGSQICAFADGKVAEAYGEVPANDQEWVRELLEGAQLPEARGTGQVDHRLRQVLVPVGGSYVALTPLHSAGLSQRIATLLQEKGRGKRAIVPVGGANPQNVGIRVRAMQEPLVFSAPTENVELCNAYRVHHRGIVAGPDKVLAREYHEWRTRRLFRNGKPVPSTLQLRELEYGWLRQMVRQLAGRVAKARDLLENAGFEPLLSQKLPLWQRSLIDPSERTAGWDLDVAAQLLRSLARNVPRKQDGAPLQPLSDNDAAAMRAEVSVLVKELC